MTSDQLLSSYDYILPSELIAQNPTIPRDRSRLLVIDPNTHIHSVFGDLTNWLLPGDLLVLNNTQVIPARLYGRKATGAPIEILLLEDKGDNCWLALVKPGKRFKLGSEIWFHPFSNSQQLAGEVLKAKVIDRDLATGGRILQFQVPCDRSFFNLLEQFGRIPLPPYVTASNADPSQYQTVYAQYPGSVAAPTAGLHFTEELLQNLKGMRVNLAYVTLHVGVGTFRPVEAEDITEHLMHREWIELPQITADLVRETKTRGSRVIAVGTTATRTLEGAMKEIRDKGGDELTHFQGKTDLFIYPGYQWQVIDGLITNFHLPKSSLLMLVSALIGRERLLSLYQEAIAQKYRFYSFGDAMLILPSAVI